MLVLSRKRNQIIRIGDDIVVHVCQVKGSVVRLGIEAPEDIRIMRGELPNWGTPDKVKSIDPGLESFGQAPSANV